MLVQGDPESYANKSSYYCITIITVTITIITLFTIIYYFYYYYLYYNYYYYYSHYIEICQISNIAAFRITISSHFVMKSGQFSHCVTDPSIEIWREFEVYLRENVFLFMN